MGFVQLHMVPGGMSDRTATPDHQIRAILDLTDTIERAVSDGDTNGALVALGCLRDRLEDHFRAQEHAMARVGQSHENNAHRRDHQALLSGLGAIHCAIVSENLSRLSHQVGAYVQRIVRHVVERDVPFSESLAAA